MRLHWWSSRMHPQRKNSLAFCFALMATGVVLGTAMLYLFAYTNQGQCGGDSLRSLPGQSEAAARARLLSSELDPTADPTTVDVRAACKEKDMECGDLEIQRKLLVSCGECLFPATCGGGGVANRCACKAASCNSVNRTCGRVPDGCGGVQICGPPCTAPVLVPGAWEALQRERAVRPFRVGHLAHWAQYNEGPRRFLPEDIQGKYFTHLSFAFAGFDKDLNLTPPAPDAEDGAEGNKGMWSRFVDACRAQGVVPMIGIGKPGIFGEEGAKILDRVRDSEKARKDLARNVARWMRTHGFQGLDINAHHLEEEAAPSFIILLQAIRTELRKVERESGQRQWISVNVLTTAPTAVMAGLADTVDFVELHACHFWRRADGGEGMGRHPDTGPHSGLFGAEGESSVDRGVSRWLDAGFPASQLLVIISTQAELWELQSAEGAGMGRPIAQTQDGVVKEAIYLPNADLRIRFDGASSGRMDLWHTPSSTLYAFSGRDFAVYENQRSAALKVDYAIQRGLAGLAIVYIDMDDDGAIARTITERLQVTDPIVSASASTPATSATTTASSGSRKGAAASPARARMLVTPSVSPECRDSSDGHVLAGLLKNKADYALRHGWTLTETPASSSVRERVPRPTLLKELLRKNPEVEWFLWADSGLVFTNMEATLSLDRYAGFDLVLRAAAKCPKGDLSVSASAAAGALGEEESAGAMAGGPCMDDGVVLLRNGKWALSMLRAWEEARDVAGRREEQDEAGRTRREILSGTDADLDAFLHLLTSKKRLRSKIYLEGALDLGASWKAFVPRMKEFRDHADVAGPALRWREEEHAPGLAVHFVDCQLCGGAAMSAAVDGDEEEEDGSNCRAGMERLLKFAEEQVAAKTAEQQVNGGGSQSNGGGASEADSSAEKRKRALTATTEVSPEDIILPSVASAGQDMESMGARLDEEEGQTSSFKRRLSEGKAIMFGESRDRGLESISARLEQEARISSIKARLNNKKKEHANEGVRSDVGVTRISLIKHRVSNKVVGKHAEEGSGNNVKTGKLGEESGARLSKKNREVKRKKTSKLSKPVEKLEHKGDADMGDPYGHFFQTDELLTDNLESLVVTNH